VRLPIIGIDGDLIGYIYIDARTFHPGTILAISAPTIQRTIQHSSDGGCESIGYEQVSPAVDLQVENAPSEHFDPPVHIQLGAQSVDQEDSDSLCLGSSHNLRSDPVRCHDEGTKINNINTTTGSLNSTVMGETTHFTTFAVLLMSSQTSSNCNRWIWPASMSLLGLTLILSLLFSIAIIRSKKLKAWFYGFTGAGLDDLVKTVRLKQMPARQDSVV